MQFSEQTDTKNPCGAVFSVIFKMADTTNTCVLPTRLVSCMSKTWGDRHACFAVKCNLSYPASYRDSCIRILYVSYRGEMYRCRPLKNEWGILLLTQSPVLLISSGTLFMVKLHEQLKYFVNDKVSSDPAWQGLRIYLSGHEVRQELKYSKRWYMYCT